MGSCEQGTRSTVATNAVDTTQDNHQGIHQERARLSGRGGPGPGLASWGPVSVRTCVPRHDILLGVGRPAPSQANAESSCQWIFGRAPLESTMVMDPAHCYYG